MRRRWTLLILALTGALALMYYQVHIKVESSGETGTREENAKEHPGSATSCQLKELEELEKKLFGRVNASMLDAAKAVIERGGKEVEGLIDHYGRICFSFIAHNLRNCSIEIYAHPLARAMTHFVFSYSQIFSVRIDDKFEGKCCYREVTDDELKVLLNAYNFSKYDEHFFVAAELEDFTLLYGFGWESKPVLLDGLEAHEGVQVTITYESGEVSGKSLIA